MDRRVLVVDDEPMIVDGLSMMFELENIQAATALDYDGAVAALADLFYPVIIADLRLRSEAEGRRLLAAIHERTPESRVVVLTAYATPEIEESLLAAGVSMVLHKPVSSDTMIAAFNALLEELEKAAGSGEVDIGALYSTLQRKLVSIPRRRFGLSAQNAEDVVQEAWLLFLHKRGLVRNAGPWLAGAVANLSRQQLDRHVRKRENPGDELMETMHDGRGGNLTDRIAIRQAIGQLDERARMLCSLIVIDGLSYEEVSSRSGIPLGSVGPLFLRAKKRMRNILEH